MGRRAAGCFGWWRRGRPLAHAATAPLLQTPAPPRAAGPGAFFFKQGDRNGTAFWRRVRNFLSAPSPMQEVRRARIGARAELCTGGSRSFSQPALTRRAQLAAPTPFHLLPHSAPLCPPNPNIPGVPRAQAHRAQRRRDDAPLPLAALRRRRLAATRRGPGHCLRPRGVHDDGGAAAGERDPRGARRRVGAGPQGCCCGADQHLRLLCHHV
jgi:hypothetical protein